MVIFGAGASHDSLARISADAAPDLDWRPPLANKLFDARWGEYIGQFRQAASLIVELERSNDVEGLLERFQNDAETYPRLKVPLTAIRFYLRSMISNCQRFWEDVTRGVTNYAPLLYRIDRYVSGEKLLVDFNYDTLLEEALDSTIGLKIRSLSDYLKSNYLLAKPHGSTDWIHRITAPKFQPGLNMINAIIDNAQRLEISPSIEYSLPPPERVVPSDPVIPAISIPVAVKSHYECPQEQEATLVQSFPSVTKVLVIGWRATETRFLKSFAEGIGKNRPRVFVVSRNGASAAQVLGTLRARLSEVNAEASFVSPYPQGFSQAATSSELESFLKS